MNKELLSELLRALSQRPFNSQELSDYLKTPLGVVEAGLTMLEARHYIEPDQSSCPSAPALETSKSVCGGCSTRSLCSSRQDLSEQKSGRFVLTLRGRKSLA